MSFCVGGKIIVTIIAIIMIMAGYFLILYAAVAFIQDKRLFSSAPKEVFAVIPEKRLRFRSARIIGWFIIIIALLLFIGAIILAAWDGIRNDFNFLKFFVRFLTMLYVIEIYDIVFFDWVLLCHSNFFPHYCPEVKDLVGPHLFGFNKKAHIIHFIMYIPVSAVIAWVCTLF